jgi:hypothetical protein
VEIHEEARDVKNVVRMMRLALELDPGDAGLKQRLAYYVELNRNDALRQFEMLPLPQLSEFCARLAQRISKADTIKSIDINKDGSIDVLLSRTTKTQNIIFLFRFMRARAGEIGEMPIRDLYSKMKSKSGEKAFFVSNVKYTEGAVNFALTRVVTLIDREQLLSHLENMKA